MKNLSNSEALGAFLDGKVLRRRNSNFYLVNHNSINIMDAVCAIMKYNDWMIVEEAV